MSKSTHESGSGKRKKLTAKADVLRAVIEKMKSIIQFPSVPEGSTSEVAPDLESTPAGSYFFLSDTESKKIFERKMDPE